jgi:hypothetical protein
VSGYFCNSLTIILFPGRYLDTSHNPGLQFRMCKNSVRAIPFHCKKQWSLSPRFNKTTFVWICCPTNFLNFISLQREASYLKGVVSTSFALNLFILKFSEISSSDNTFPSAWGHLPLELCYLGPCGVSTLLIIATSICRTFGLQLHFLSVTAVNPFPLRGFPLTSDKKHCYSWGMKFIM